MFNQSLHDTNRILIADDDPVILEIVKALVEGEGYEVVTAKDGREAYRILHKDSAFRAVILDMVMPHLEGSDLLRQMQTEKRLSRIPVIIMSASDDIKVTATSFEAGAVAFIPKPFTPDQMRNTLRLVTFKDEPAAIPATPGLAPGRDGGPVAKPPANTIKVLLIEDNPGEAIVIESALLNGAAKLPRLGNVAVSRTGLLSGGIERLNAGGVDVVMLDLSLPDSEGLDSLNTLLKQNAGVPVVILTGTDDSTVATEAMRLGAKDYLIKGQVDEGGMIRAIRQAFAGKEKGSLD